MQNPLGRQALERILAVAYGAAFILALSVPGGGREH
jgi:hypothetical protein